MKKTEELAKLAAHYEAIGRPDLAREVDAAVASHTIRLSSGNKVSRETERLEREMAGVMDPTDLERKTGRRPTTHTPQDSIAAHAPFQQAMDEAGRFTPVYPGSQTLMMNDPEAYDKAYQGMHRDKKAMEGKFRYDTQRRVRRMIEDIDGLRTREGYVVNEKDAKITDRIKEIIARHDPANIDARQVDNFDYLTSEFDSILSEVWKRAKERHYAIERKKGIPSPADESYARSQARRRASTDGRILFRVAQGDPFGDEISDEDLALLEKNKREEMKRAFEEMLAKMTPEERQFFEDFGMTHEEARKQQAAEIEAERGMSEYVTRGGPEPFDEEDPRERDLYSGLSTSDLLLRLAHCGNCGVEASDEDGGDVKGLLGRQKEERAKRPAQPSDDGISTHCNTCGTNSPGDHDHCPLCFSDYVERKPNPKMNEFRMSYVSDALLRMAQFDEVPGDRAMGNPAPGDVDYEPSAKLIAHADGIGDLFLKDDGDLLIQTDEDTFLPIEPEMAIKHFGDHIAKLIGVEPNPLAGTKDMPEPRGNVFHNPNWEEESGTRP